jgi:hypothetical protein
MTEFPSIGTTAARSPTTPRHIIEGLRAGTGWDVRFVPSRSAGCVSEGDRHGSALGHRAARPAGSSSFSSRPVPRRPRPCSRHDEGHETPRGRGCSKRQGCGRRRPVRRDRRQRRWSVRTSTASAEDSTPGACPFMQGDRAVFRAPHGAPRGDSASPADRPGSTYWRLPQLNEFKHTSAQALALLPTARGGRWAPAGQHRQPAGGRPSLGRGPAPRPLRSRPGYKLIHLVRRAGRGHGTHLRPSEKPSMRGQIYGAQWRHHNSPGR